ncbi:hypothetical protein ACFWIO_16215 [Streptomyces diastatochromogenes]|uniref:hypothetical protein n=1 Tax=Streptomyces diastatochromogenes TaxID=42236 RepID=UPI00364DA4AE
MPVAGHEDQGDLYAFEGPPQRVGLGVYALPGGYGADLYEVPAGGSGRPRRISRAAVSPATSPEVRPQSR